MSQISHRSFLANHRPHHRLCALVCRVLYRPPHTCSPRCESPGSLLTLDHSSLWAFIRRHSQQPLPACSPSGVASFMSPAARSCIESRAAGLPISSISVTLKCSPGGNTKSMIFALGSQAGIARSCITSIYFFRRPARFATATHGGKDEHKLQ